MGKPVERQNHALSFFILSTLTAICTGWAFYDEYIARRPWKDYQSAIFDHEQEKLRRGQRFFERKIQSGEIKVTLDPQQPDQVTTVAEARKRLEALEQGLAQKRAELGKLEKQITDQEVLTSDADIHVKFLRGDDDGLFYEFQHAQHEEMIERARAQKAKADGNAGEANAANRRADEHVKEVERVSKKRDELHRQIAEAEK